MTLQPTWKLQEYVCNENDRCPLGKCAERMFSETPADTVKWMQRLLAVIAWTAIFNAARMELATPQINTEMV